MEADARGNDPEVVADVLTDSARRRIAEFQRGRDGPGPQYLAIAATRMEAERLETSIASIGSDDLEDEIESTHVPLLEDAGVVHYGWTPSGSRWTAPRASPSIRRSTGRSAGWIRPALSSHPSGAGAPSIRRRSLPLSLARPDSRAPDYLRMGTLPLGWGTVRPAVARPSS